MIDPVNLVPIVDFAKNIMRETIAGGYMVLSTIFCIILYKHLRKIEKNKSDIIDQWVIKYQQEVESHKKSILDAKEKIEKLLEEHFNIIKALDKTLDKTIDALEEKMDE